MAYRGRFFHGRETGIGVPAIAQQLEERGRPLDVGEEESDPPGRQAGHGYGLLETRVGPLAISEVRQDLQK